MKLAFAGTVRKKRRTSMEISAIKLPFADNPSNTWNE
jgi:hypothetical protein